MSRLLGYKIRAEFQICIGRVSVVTIDDDKTCSIDGHEFSAKGVDANYIANLARFITGGEPDAIVRFIMTH